MQAATSPFIAAYPVWKGLFHAPSVRNCIEPAARLPQSPRASSIRDGSSPRTRPAAAAAPNTPQVAVGWNPRR